MTTTKEHFKNLLLAHDVQPSNYRIRVLEYLDVSNFHPTADEIFQQLLIDFPTLSKMTVYNTIDVLLSASLIKKVTMGNIEARYDAVLSQHGHFKCYRCQKIYDFNLDVNQLTIQGLTDFNISHKDIYFYGTCAQCSAKEN